MVLANKAFNFSKNLRQIWWKHTQYEESKLDHSQSPMRPKSDLIWSVSSSHVSDTNDL